MRKELNLKSLSTDNHLTIRVSRTGDADTYSLAQLREAGVLDRSVSSHEVWFTVHHECDIIFENKTYYRGDVITLI